MYVCMCTGKGEREGEGHAHYSDGYYYIKENIYSGDKNAETKTPLRNIINGFSFVPSAWYGRPYNPNL